MKKCPKCGSETIRINGVLQRKKGLLYHLSGQAMQDMSMRSGYKLGAKLARAGAAAEPVPNAECVICGHKWAEK